MEHGEAAGVASIRSTYTTQWGPKSCAGRHVARVGLREIAFLALEVAGQSRRRPDQPIFIRSAAGSRVSGLEPRVRIGELGDCDAIGRLLDSFNREFDDPTPGPASLSRRMQELISEGATTVLLGGTGPDGLAVLRFRPSIWTAGLECYLAELYVVPAHRGRGLGRALLETAIELTRERGADYMDLNTREDDVIARALYESLGFSNREGKPAGPVNYYYERTL